MWKKIIQNKKILILCLAVTAFVVVVIIVIALPKRKTQKTLPSSTDTVKPQQTSTIQSDKDNQPLTQDGTLYRQEGEEDIPAVGFTPEDEGTQGAPSPSDVLLTSTPFYTEHFSVVYNRNDKTYEITLYAILNYAWQITQYQADLKQYKQEALVWISQFGVDPTKLKIKYIPEEAKGL